MSNIITGPYFLENIIPTADNDIFVVTKHPIWTSYNTETGEFGSTNISRFKYKQDVEHVYINVDAHAKVMIGECEGCGVASYGKLDDATWGDILILGLGGFGVLPEYIKNQKKPTSIDVVEEYQEIIDYVTWLNNSINIVCNDEWSYATLKKYDIIICDLWAESQDVLDNHKETLLNNYSDNLKAGGKLFIPLTGEILN